MAKHCNMHSVIFICPLKRYSKAYKTYYRGVYNHCKRLHTTFLKASFGENDERNKSEEHQLYANWIHVYCLFLT